MKYKTTKKAMLNGYTYTIVVPYCTLQNLLAYEVVAAYTARREGWAADIYDFGDTAIITGYAPFGGIKPDYETTQKYEQKAEQIRSYYNYDYKKCKRRLRELISEFIEEVTTK